MHACDMIIVHACTMIIVIIHAGLQYVHQLCSSPMLVSMISFSTAEQYRAIARILLAIEHIQSLSYSGEVHRAACISECCHNSLVF